MMTRVARCNERKAVADVILRANPHIGHRMDAFLLSGCRWHDATAFVVEVDGAIVSTAVVFRRKVIIGASARRFAGIGAVATIPEARGKGFATSLMRCCEDYLCDRGYRAAILYCTLVEFYGRMGWRPVPEDIISFQLAKTAVRRPQGLVIQAYEAGSTPAALQRLYRDADPSRGGAIARSRGIYDDYLRWPRHQGNLSFAAFADRHPVACVHGRAKEGGGIELMEATCKAGWEEAIVHLLHEQRKTIRGNEGTTFEAVLSPTHPLVKVLAGSGVDCVWRKTDAMTGTMMVKEPGVGTGEEPGRGNRASTGKRARQGGDFLQIGDFGDAPPWYPRTWWMMDRF